MRRKNKLRFGIQFRLMVGMALLFGLSAVLVNLIVSGQIRQNYEHQIRLELQDLKTNADIYCRQLLIIGEHNNDEESFADIAEDLEHQMQGGKSGKVGAYRLSGSPLTASAQALYASGTQADLDMAAAGKNAYTLIPLEDGGLTARFSCPVAVEGKQLGILRFERDYSFHRQQSQQTATIVLFVTLGVFGVTCLVMLIMARSVTRPVLLLSRISTRVARDIGKDLDAYPQMRHLRKRRDELGLLANNYSNMVEKINQQFDLIQKDRDRILELYEYKQEFYNNVTHELKTPLTTIQGYAELIQQNGFKDKAFFAKGMDHITAESKRLHEMVIKLLEMGNRTDRGPAQAVNLSRLTEDTAEAMRLKAKRYDNTFDLRVAPELWVLGHGDQLRELLINLLDNAIKYGEPGQPIGVELAVEEGLVLLKVANAGAGLTLQQQKDIFTPFYRVDKQLSRERGSSGLGLSICQRIVEEHQGTLTVQSEPGALTVFTVALPQGTPNQEEEA